MERRPIAATVKTPAQNFTGDVYLTPIFNGDGTSRLVVGLVGFTPRARTNWHSHAKGSYCSAPMVSAWSSPATAPPSACAPARRSGPRPGKSTGTAAPRRT
jgi:hypothetical protein